MFIDIFINIIILNIEEKNMAFDNNQDKISNLLKSTDTTPKNSTNSNFEFERTKQFMFSLQPSVREKITQIAHSRGYRSGSSFLNDYFKNFDL